MATNVASTETLLAAPLWRRVGRGRRASRGHFTLRQAPHHRADDARRRRHSRAQHRPQAPVRDQGWVARPRVPRRDVDACRVGCRRRRPVSHRVGSGCSRSVDMGGCGGRPCTFWQRRSPHERDGDGSRQALPARCRRRPRPARSRWREPPGTSSRRGATRSKRRRARPKRKGFVRLSSATLSPARRGQRPVGGWTRRGTCWRCTRAPVCVVSAGETTVRVTGSGRGGRNQEFVLALARRLSTIDRELMVASVGTDGIDGPTDAAGAIVDRSTLSRAAAKSAVARSRPRQQRLVPVLRQPRRPHPTRSHRHQRRRHAGPA